MIAEIDRAREAGDTLGGAFEVIAHGRAARPRQLRAVGPQARRPAGAGADVDSGDQGGRHRPRAGGRRIVPARASTTRSSRIPAGPHVTGVSRPTNNAGGLEGGVTNGEDLRVSAYMKPISTLMKPLRSVDLTTMTGVAGGDRAQRRLRRPGRRGRRRSDGRARARRRAAREIRRRLDRATSIARSRRRRRRRARSRSSRNDPTDPPLRRRRRCTTPAADVATFDDDLQRLIDDMIETMYAAPGVGLAAPQVGVPLRIFVVDLSSAGRDPKGLIVDDQPGVRRARRHAARRRRLPERARLQRHGRPARARAVVRASIATASEQTIEGTGLLARAFQHEMDHLDGTLFVDRLRGIKRDLIVRQDPEAEARRQMVTAPPLRIVFFGTPAFAVPTLAGAARLAARRRRRRVAAGSAERARAAGRRRPPTKAVALAHGVPVLQPERLRDEAFLEPMRDSAAGPRRRRRVRADPARRAARDPAARHDQRARLAAAALSRRGAGPSRGDRRRRRDRRHDHARRQGARRRADARDRPPADRPGRDQRRGRARPRASSAPVCWSTSSTRSRTAARSRRRRDPQGVTYAPKLTKAESAVDWTGRRRSIHNLVRGLQPWPLVAARLGGRRVLDPPDRADGRAVESTAPARSSRAAATICESPPATGSSCGSSSSSPKGAGR